MAKHVRAKTPAFPVLLTAIASVLGMIGQVSAHEARTPASKAVPCAVLETFGGDVQLLDASRMTLLDTVQKSAIECGSWVSLKDGWARIRHKDGQRIHAGANTFMQILDSNADGKKSADQMVLFKGQAYIQSPRGTGEFRVTTANARSRISGGSALVIYDSKNEESQLVSIGKKSTMENRFQGLTPVTVHAGEATALNLKALRVIPSTPLPVSAASLKQKLLTIRLDEKEAALALKVAHERAERKFAVALAPAREKAPALEGAKTRQPAGLLLERNGPVHPEYTQHPARADDARLKDHWVKKMVADQEDGEKILFPQKYRGPSVAAKVEVIDPLAGSKRNRQREDDAERKRLIKELSEIRSD